MIIAFSTFFSPCSPLEIRRNVPRRVTIEAFTIIDIGKASSLLQCRQFNWDYLIVSPSGNRCEEGTLVLSIERFIFPIAP